MTFNGRKRPFTKTQHGVDQRANYRIEKDNRDYILLKDIGPWDTSNKSGNGLRQTPDAPRCLD